MVSQYWIRSQVSSLYPVPPLPVLGQMAYLSQFDWRQEYARGCPQVRLCVKFSHVRILEHAAADLRHTVAVMSGPRLS